MRKKLSIRGNGWLLSIPKTIIKMLGVSPETSKLIFKIKNKTLYIREISPDNPDCTKYLVRSFSRQNSGWGFYMPNSILELLDINPEVDLVNLEMEDTVLIIRKLEKV